MFIAVGLSFLSCLQAYISHELPRGVITIHPPVFFKRHNFSGHIFQKRFRTLLGYSLPHLLVNKFQKHVALRWICIEKSDVSRRRWLPPPPSTSQLLDKIGTKFQRLAHVFGGKVSNNTIGNTVRRNQTSEIQDGGLQSGNTYILTCRQDSNEIPTAIPMFLGGKISNGTIGNAVRRNQKSEIQDGGLQSGNTYTLTCI